MGKEIYRKIYKTIKEYDTIIIARHIGPDPDAIGSQVALRDAIKLTFPHKKVYAVGISVAKYKFLGHLDKIDDSLVINPLLILVDIPNKERIDGVSLENYQTVIKIDHHPYGEKLGTLELVDEACGSTCELIMRLIKHTSLKMNEQVAQNLFAGIASDSDRFLLPTTSYETFSVCSELLKNYHLNIKEIYNKLYERPLNEARLQAFITLNMTVTENSFAYIKLSNDIIKNYGFDATSVSNMVNNFNFIKEIKAWAFVTYDEKQELFRANIRSRGPVINEVAASYNGGGHKFAAGARIKDETDVDLLIRDLNEVCKIYQNNPE